jgi:hypothetical protein
LPAPAVAIPILLVTCESTWLAPIRMPGALARAGFEVTLLAPPDAVAARSRYVARSRALPADANPREWLLALVAAIDASRPQILLPGDETSLRLLQAFVLSPPPLLGRELTRALADLIVHSLGAPQFYDAATDKARLAPLMHAAGVRMPEQIVVRTPGEAARAAAELGPAVVLKPSNGTGGRDVIVCDSPEAAAAAFQRVLGGQRGVATLDRDATVIVQRRIAGQMLGRTSVAWRGVELAGFSRERLQTIRALGGSTVVRYVHAPEATAFSQRTARALHSTGFMSAELCIEYATGNAYLIDLTRRISPPTHPGSYVGVDLCAAFARAMRGEIGPPIDVPPGTSSIMTLFPQEFWRDPQSPALRRYPTDVPWDDPPLLRELMQWRYDLK